MKNSWYKKGIVFGIIILFIGMSVVPSNAIKVMIEKPSTASFDGNTLYVGGSGPGNYSNIQDALDDAVDNDTVFVFDDSSPYYENLIISNSISLIGEDRDTTIIDGGGGSSVITIVSDNVTIKNFFIQNGGEDGDNGGISIKSNRAEIINNNIKHNPFYGISTAKYSDDNIMSENNIGRNSGGGIICGWDSIRNIITKNIISNNERSGIFLGRSHYNIITENNIFNNGDSGIKILLAGSNYISENCIDSNDKYGIYCFDCSNNVFSKNDIFNHAEIGLKIYKSHHTYVYNNSIWYNDEGITAESFWSSIISGNTISNNKKHGLLLESCDDNNIIDNEFNQNRDGLGIYDYCWGNNISNNVFFNDGLFFNIEIFGYYSNVYSNNMVNGKPLVILEEETNLVFDDEVGQLILINCNEITIRNLDISNTTVGIQMVPSSNCRIEHNKFNDNSNYGVYMIGSNNKIFHNDFRKNSCGLYWQGVSNTVEQNNFIDNNRDARFRINHGTIYSTKWVSNYWDRPRIFMKSISGIKDFRYTDRFGEEQIISFPWIGFDWSPAKSPYTIL